MEGEGCWNPIFTRLLNDWEVEVVERLLFKAFLVKPMYKALEVRLPISLYIKIVWSNCA